MSVWIGVREPVSRGKPKKDQIRERDAQRHSCTCYSLLFSYYYQTFLRKNTIPRLLILLTLLSLLLWPSEKKVGVEWNG